MRKLACVAFVLLLPRLAAAQVEDGYAPPAAVPVYTPPVREVPAPAAANLQGLTLGIGFGYGIPFGDILKSSSSGSGVSMSDGISGQIPFALSVGYRVGPLFSFGAVFQYAPLTTKNCDSGSSCSASDTRIGLEARVHLLAEEPFSPWFSLGGGYEWFSLSESGAQSGSGTLTGLDLDLQVGGDYRLAPFLTLGPYVGLRLGNYDSGSSGGSSADIPDANQATHGWLTFGARGAFTL